MWERGVEASPDAPVKNESLHQPCYHMTLSGGKAHFGHPVASCVFRDWFLLILELISTIHMCVYVYIKSKGQTQISKSLNHIFRPQFPRHLLLLLSLLPPPAG